MTFADGTAPQVNFRRGGHGEPLLLIHGIGSSLRAWTPVVAALERGHDVLAVDLPGFGESPPLPEGTVSTVPALADALERALDAAGIDEAHVAGNSLGGWIGLELARRARARSVVALSPAGMQAPRERAYSYRALQLARLGARRMEPLAPALARTAAGRALLAGSMMSRPWRQDPDELAYAVRVLARAPGWQPTLDWTHSHQPQGLDEIRCPVLIAWGTRDMLLLPRQGPRFAARIPGAELRSLPGLGHVPMSDDADLVARTIADFTLRAAGRRTRSPAAV